MPQYDLSEGKYKSRPPEDAKGAALWMSYGSLMVLFGLMGAVALPMVYYYLRKPGRITWASMTFEQREAWYRDVAQGFWFRVWLGVGLGILAAVVFLLSQKKKNQS